MTHAHLSAYTHIHTHTHTHTHTWTNTTEKWAAHDQEDVHIHTLAGAKSLRGEHARTDSGPHLHTHTRAR